MNPRTIPGVGFVLDAGPDDRVYDGLLLLGPVIILLAVLDEVVPALGGHILVEALVIAYLAVLVGYVLYRGLGADAGS